MRQGREHFVVGRPELEQLEPRVLLSTYTVTTLADAGAGSLRQAILDANANPGADVVDFQAGLTGQVVLTSGRLQIVDDLDILGPGQDELTIDAAGNGGVFYVDAAVTNATITGLTITGGFGSHGGGIYNYGTLTITNATISANEVWHGAGGEFVQPHRRHRRLHGTGWDGNALRHGRFAAQCPACAAGLLLLRHSDQDARSAARQPGHRHRERRTRTGPSRPAADDRPARLRPLRGWRRGQDRDRGHRLLRV